MLHRALARPAAYAAAVLAALTPVTAASPASAGLLGPCEAYAYVPTWENDRSAQAFGGFRCDTAKPGLTVTVCLEALTLNVWETVSCESAEAAGAADVSAIADGCFYGVYLIRSVATGTASTGETGTAASGAVPYLCIPPL